MHVITLRNDTQQLPLKQFNFMFIRTICAHIAIIT